MLFSQKIQNDITYSGQVRIIVIRETRVGKHSKIIIFAIKKFYKLILKITLHIVELQ